MYMYTCYHKNATSTHKCATLSAHAYMITSMSMHIHAYTYAHSHTFIHTCDKLAYHVCPCVCKCSMFTCLYMCIYAVIDHIHRSDIYVGACTIKPCLCSHACTHMLTHICVHTCTSTSCLHAHTHAHRVCIGIYEVWGMR